ncbi:MAG: aquaporin [Phycisphaerae bacterium]|nr:aquaporin [Phycisphaerae bacterium]
MEAALLGTFMISACAFCTLLEHPDGPGRRALRSSFARRVLMGLAMGLTAMGLIYSPWGRQSGAHMNPATTLTFFSRGKVAPWDAHFYVVAQLLGAVFGVTIARFALRDWLRHASVNHVVTAPGRFGVMVAWGAELAIAFGMMFMVLYVSNDAVLTAYTGLFAGSLVALYITFEAPLSGMSLNPARTFGSAVVARHWKAFWVYLTAPLAGMLLASGVYAALPFHNHVYCAKLDHCNDRRCIFRCEFEQLRPRTASTDRDAGRP